VIVRDPASDVSGNGCASARLPMRVQEGVGRVCILSSSPPTFAPDLAYMFHPSQPFPYLCQSRPCLCQYYFTPVHPLNPRAMPYTMDASFPHLPVFPHQSPHSEMAPFTFTSPFKKSRCMTDGQLTPPSSPDDIHPSTKISGGARSHLSKLFKRSQSTRSSAQTRRNSVVLKRNGFRATASPGGPSVRDMKVAFPLLPSESPITTDINSISSQETAPRLELRRVSSCHRNLRAVAQQQQCNLTVPSPSPLPTPLLPSPIIDDRKMLNKKPSQSYFQFQNPKTSHHKRRESTYRSYEDLHILSMYEEESRRSSTEDMIHDDEEECGLSRTEASHDSDSSISSSPMPITPPNRIAQLTVGSSESVWLANTTSQEERIRRFKSRCYQVVQHPCRVGPPTHDDENQIVSSVALHRSNSNVQLTGVCYCPCRTRETKTCPNTATTLF